MVAGEEYGYARNLIPLEDQDLLSLPHAQKAKETQTRLVVRISDPVRPEKWLYIKRYLPRTTFKRFLGRFFRSKVLLEYRQTLRAGSLGIPVPQVVAVAEIRRWGVWQKGFLMTSAVDFDMNLEQFAESVKRTDPLRKLVRKRLARLLADSHAKGFIHDDLNADHVLIAIREGQPVIHWIDLANALFTRRTQLWHRVKNLTQLHKSLPAEYVSLRERLRFLLDYGAASGLSRKALKELIARVHAVTMLKKKKNDNGLRTIVWLWKNFAPLKRN